MELSEIFCFFININHQSIKLILRNGKSMASIAIVTHSLLSIVLFFLSISIKSLLYSIDKYSSTPSSSQGTFLGHMLVYMALLLLVEVAFIFVFVAISHVSLVAEILISAASYTGKNNISFQDFVSMIAGRWKRPLTTGFRGSRTQPGRYAALVVFMAVVVLMMYPSFLTISISILLGMVAAVFVMYSSVAWILATVASVVEEGSFGEEALVKGEELAKGNRVHGFLLNIFWNLVVLVPFLGCWWIFGDKVLLDSPIFWLVMVNLASLVKMLATVEYTVLYFECKKFHGEEIVKVFADLQYTKVPSDEAAQV